MRPFVDDLEIWELIDRYNNSWNMRVIPIYSIKNWESFLTWVKLMKNNNDDQSYIKIYDVWSDNLVIHLLKDVSIDEFIAEQLEF